MVVDWLAGVASRMIAVETEAEPETATDWGCRRIALLQVAVPLEVELVVDDLDHTHSKGFRHQ